MIKLYSKINCGLGPSFRDQAFVADQYCSIRVVSFGCGLCRLHTFRYNLNSILDTPSDFWRPGFPSHSHSILMRLATNLHRTSIYIVVLDISCLTRDRFVHHTLKYKRVLMGMSQNNIPIFYIYMIVDQATLTRSCTVKSDSWSRKSFFNLYVR